MNSYRLLCFALLEMLSPFHLGGGKEDTSFSDQPILRDLKNIPFIPGGTLAGGFSSFLNPDERGAWLGIPVSDSDDPSPSSIVFDDAYLLPSQQDTLRWPIEIRERNTLLRDTLTAKEDHHFQMEVLPVGTTFCFFCRGDFDSLEEKESYKARMEEFLFSGGSFGGLKNAGMGNWRTTEVGWSELNLSDPADIRIWLKVGHGLVWSGNWEALPGTLRVIRKNNTFGGIGGASWQMVLKVKIEKGLHLSAGSSGVPKKNFPDQTQAVRQKIDPDGQLSNEVKEYVDFGTTIKGRIRTTMEMLLRTYLLRFCRKGEEEIKALLPVDPTKTGSWNEVADFFGHHKKRGGWAVEEIPWFGDPEPSVEDHIKINEFTQQTITHAKFDFAPLARGESAVVVRLPLDAPEWQKTLVFFAGKVLALNILPWGGKGSRGYLGARLTVQEPDPESIQFPALKSFIEEEFKCAT